MKITIIPLSILTAILFACNNPDQKPVTKNVEIQKPNADSGFKVTSVKHEQHFTGTYNFKTKKANVDQNSKTEVSVDYLIKISDKEILISTADGKIIESFKINQKKENKALGFIEYDTKNNKDIRVLVSHVIEKDGSYSYFEFRSSDNLKFYTTT